MLLVVHPSVPAKTLPEFLALARAKPGALNYGSSGPGSNYHMAAELLKSLTGIDIVHVPYKGSTGMRSDILSGQIQMLFDSISDHGADHSIRHGPRARDQRPDPLADPARRADLHRSRRARFSGNTVGRLHGCTKATPQPIVDQLSRTITDILKRQEIKNAWEKQGASPMVMTQAVFTAFMESEIAKWAKVIRANHIALIN